MLTTSSDFRNINIYGTNDAYIICIVTLMMLILYTLWLWWCLCYTHCDSAWWCLYYMHCDSADPYIIRIVTRMVLISYALWLWWCLYYTHCDSDDAYIIHIEIMLSILMGIYRDTQKGTVSGTKCTCKINHSELITVNKHWKEMRWNDCLTRQLGPSLPRFRSFIYLFIFVEFIAWND